MIRTMTQPSECSALILAAGKGTRMKSRLPKVMQPLLEEPMLYYVLRSLNDAGITDIAVVVGYGGEDVSAWLAKNAPGATVVWQKEQLGTGHAVMAASEWLRGRSRVLIVNGDMPMVTSDEINDFLAQAEGADAAFVSCDLDDPAQYGRVVRYGSNVSIVEARDATPEQLALHEVNAGVYLFNVGPLLEGLSHLTCANNQREYYIVDLIPWACAEGLKVLPVKLPAENLAGVNNPLELSRLSLRMRDRILERWLLSGVKCVDPSTVWISPRVEFAGEATLYPNVQLWGNTRIGDGCTLESGTVLRNCVLHDRVRCHNNVVAQDVTAEDDVEMGPFCFVRDGTHLLKESFAGKFVEIKNSTIGERTKVPHLSYMGDAEIGPDTNIGAASVTCNYDGVNKNHTRIGAHCFVGSDTMFVAPVNVGDRASVGAGSVITDDVPADALAIARGRQVVIEGWTRRKHAEQQHAGDDKNTEG